MSNFTRPYYTLIALSVVILTYGLTAYNLPKSVFWSPDEGAKYLQMQTLLGWQGGMAYQLPYLGKRLDPTYQFYPQHPIYPQPIAPQKIQFHWPIWFPLLTIPLFKSLGLPGLYLIPLISGLGVVWLTGKITHAITPAATPLAMLAVGLASPIFFYSLLFWEHTLVIMLGLVALQQALSLNPSHYSRAALTCGLFLCATIALRPEMFFYALALLSALSWIILQRRERDLPPFLKTRRFKLIAFSLMVLMLLSLGQLPQLIAWSTQYGLIGTRYHESVDVSVRLAGNQNFWLNLPTHLRNIWINNEANAGPKLPDYLSWWSWLSLCGLIFACLTPFVSLNKRLLIGLITTLILGALSSYILILSERYRLIHSLFLPAPFLLLAVIVYTIPTPSFNLKLITRTTFVYLFFGTLITILRQGETLINPEWGARYLLMLYPLLTICASIGVSHLYETLTFNWQKPILVVLTLFLLLIGVGYEQRGLQEIRQTKRDWLALARAVAKINQPILTDFEWLPSVLAVQYIRREIYVMVERERLNEWLKLVKPHTDTFIFLSFFLLDDGLIKQANPPLSSQNSYIAGDMNFTEFKIMTTSTPLPAP